jgi:hypothetical protein
MMQRGSVHFSYGIADNLDDPKYQHYKYWSNPLETKYVSFADAPIVYFTHYHSLLPRIYMTGEVVIIQLFDLLFHFQVTECT